MMEIPLALTSKIIQPVEPYSITGDKATYTPNETTTEVIALPLKQWTTTAKKILNTATACITINPINDAPVVEDITVEEWNNKDIPLP